MSEYMLPTMAGQRLSRLQIGFMILSKRLCTVLAWIRHSVRTLATPNRAVRAPFVLPIVRRRTFRSVKRLATNGGGACRLKTEEFYGNPGGCSVVYALGWSDQECCSVGRECYMCWVGVWEVPFVRLTRVG